MRRTTLIDIAILLAGWLTLTGAAIWFGWLAMN